MNCDSIYPGATLGIVGGGQLGRMFVVAAASMGYRVEVFCRNADEPAAQIAHRVHTASLTDIEAAKVFANGCDAVTLEFENIPVATIFACQAICPTRPGPSLLAIAQDRGIEKQTLADLDLPVTPFQIITSKDDLLSFADDHGWPLVVKTCRSGYDGRGQQILQTASEADKFASEVSINPSGDWIAEKFIAYDFECSMLVVRRPGGEMQTFPLLRNMHQNHILAFTVVPADVSDTIHSRAKQIATTIAAQTELEGVLCVEFFAVGDDLIINEIAPRPHNSGHLTIEACHTSQFEQQVRAMCNLPLGNCSLRVPAAAMRNILGDGETMPSSSTFDRWIAASQTSLHWYGKKHSRLGRKLGHLTVVGRDAAEVRQRIDSL